LTKYPGVGKNTAQQLILHLKGKLGELQSSVAAVAAMTVTEVVTTSKQAVAEALEPLSARAYRDREIKRITKQLEALG
ncbi:Holliday junction branch migration protein RuvA, partial [Enterococcus faecalis]